MKTTDERKRKILEGFRNGLIVSCQVQKDDPIYTDDIVVKMAQAAKWAGAAGIRANSPEQIRAIKAAVDLPLIGLYKIWHDDTDVFITPTLEAARQVWEAGAEIIALDCTKQVTHEGTVALGPAAIVKREIPEAIIFADVSNYEEAEHAVKLGADIAGPTLYGYTAETASIESPGSARICAHVPRFRRRGIYDNGGPHLHAGGRHQVPLSRRACCGRGQRVTRPHLTAKRFTDLMSGYRSNWRDAERSKH